MAALICNSCKNQIEKAAQVLTTACGHCFCMGAAFVLSMCNPCAGAFFSTQSSGSPCLRAGLAG